MLRASSAALAPQLRRSLASAAGPAAPKPTAAAAKPAAAAAAATPKPVQLPIQLYGLHARYANALYSSASRANALPKVEADLNSIKSLLNSEPRFKTYLRNPIIKRSEKVADFDKITKGMNDVTRGFFAVLAENGRLGDLDAILATFGKLMDAERGVVKATVSSAEPLSAKQMKDLEQILTSSFLQKGQTIQLVSRVEPSILAGLQVQVGDKFVDLSAQSKLNAVNKALQTQG